MDYPQGYAHDGEHGGGQGQDPCYREGYITAKYEELRQKWYRQTLRISELEGQLRAAKEEIHRLKLNQPTGQTK